MAARRRTMKPTVEQRLRESIEQNHIALRDMHNKIARLESDNDHLRRQSDSNARVALQNREELERVHAIMDGAPGAPGPYGPHHAASVRLGAWLARLQDRSEPR